MSAQAHPGGRWRAAAPRDGRPWLLWAVLGVVVVLTLGVLIWLTRNHEIEQVQRALDRDNADAAQVLRQALLRSEQDLLGLGARLREPGDLQAAAPALFDAHREWLRLEWYDVALRPLAAADSPYHPAPAPPDAGAQAQAAQRLRETCATARQEGGGAYGASHFAPRPGGAGEEVMELCVPIQRGARVAGHLWVTWSLAGLLQAALAPTYTQRQSVALTEPDGTRLAIQGARPRPGRLFVARQPLELPGASLVLRMEGGRQAPDTLPNVLTALVTWLAIGMVSLLVLLARDFRRRQQAEEELGEALAFRKAMEDSLVTGLRARDLQGRITYVNPAFCQMVGFGAEELLGQPLPAPYWPPEHVAEYTQRQAARLAGEAPPRDGVEAIYQHRDGTRFPVLIMEAPLIGPTGKHGGWMGAVLDLSAQRRAEEQVRASNERLQASARLATVGEMASLMSHELNQPLAAIASYASGSLNLLAGAATGPLADVRTALARIAEQAGRAGKVIHSVHDLVRRRSTTRAAAAPADLVDAVLPLVQLRARKLGIAVAVDCPRTLPAVWCEATMIEQVLLNLARNGLQAMAETPAPNVLAIRVRWPDTVGATAAAVRFEVADSGSGIPEAVAASLFTPFFTTKDDGMGLGLSLCRTVVEQHGGVLEHRPNAPRGTVFSFALPLAGA